MKQGRSIVRSTTRTHALALLLSGLVTALVGSLAAGGVLVAQNEYAALAQAHTLRTELDNHHGETWEQLDARVRHELEEQRWFRRHIEVWRSPTQRLGGEVRAGSLSGWSRSPDGCALAQVEERWCRVCVAHVPHSAATVVVSSPLSAIAGAALPVVCAVCTAALLCTLVFVWLGRRAIRRSLKPLADLETRLVLHDGSMQQRLSTHPWGTHEVDLIAVAFDALLDRIAQAVEREQRFVADAAHELRTPLTRLRGQIEIVAAELGEGSAVTERLARAVRSCDELTRTADALLALARETANVVEVIDLGEVARRVQGDSSRVTVDEECEVLVCGDESLLALAARNLVDNALKYAGGDARIVVRMAGSRGEICVEDSGPGILEEERERVLLPFVRGSGHPSDVRGSGIGLALVEHVARLHYGQLELRARAPQGLAAVIRIPLWDSPDSPFKLENSA